MISTWCFMKKISLLLLMLFIPLFCYATTYEVEEVNLKIDVDDEYYVFTRNNLENNPNLPKIALSKEDMLDILVNNKIYLDVMPSDFDWEFLLFVADEELNVHNLYHLPDKMIRDTGNELKEKYQSKDFLIYEANNIKYVVIDYYDEFGYYITNYYTVINGRGYNFQLQKKEKLTSDDQELLKNFINKIEVKVQEGYEEETIEVQNQIKEYSKPFNWGALILDLSVLIVGVIIIVIIVRVKKKRGK